MYESQHGAYMSMHKQNFIKIHSLFLKIVTKTEILTTIKGHNSVENFRKIPCTGLSLYNAMFGIHRTGPCYK